MRKKDLNYLGILGAIVFIALSILAVATAWFYRGQEKQIRDKAFAELRAIGDLKAQEVARWRAERLADARVLMESPFLRSAVRDYLASPSTARADPILNRLRGIQRHYEYDELFLVDRRGHCLLSTAGGTNRPMPPVEPFEEAFARQDPVITDLHQMPDKGIPHLGTIAPLAASPGPSNRADAAIVLISNAGSYLYPMLRAWPTLNRTAETLLVRRRDDQVLFLGDLRQRPTAAMTFWLPIASHRDTPSVRAALGVRDVVEGPDYFGTPVLAYVTPIPETPWALVAKQDRAEIFAPWRVQSRIILLVFAVLAFGVVLSATTILFRYRQRHYKALYRIESQWHESLEKHRVTLEAIGDGVIATNCEGRVEFLNPVAEKMTGWSLADAAGKPLDEVFQILNEKTREKVESPVVRALREGRVVGLANHTVLIARNGHELPIADSAAPILDHSGHITGVVLVFRDQTVEQNYKLLFRKMLNGCASHVILCDANNTPVDYRFLDVNPAFERMTGLKEHDVLGKTVLEVLPATEPEWIERYGRVALTGEPVQFESYARNLDRHFVVSAFRTLPHHFATIFSDVTEIKRMEEQLKRQNEELRRFNDLATGRELRMIELKKEVNELSRQLHRAPPYPLRFLHDVTNDDS